MQRQTWYLKQIDMKHKQGGDHILMDGNSKLSSYNATRGASPIGKPHVSESSADRGTILTDTL